MKIYKQEIKDGIAELVKANASIAICSEVAPYSPTDLEIAHTKAIAENIDQTDLYYLKAVLASVGWNKNDDVFDRAETWNARTSPEDKQFNYMHDEKDIIGHITSAYIADELGNRVDDINDSNQLPQYFDVVMGSVLYKSWSDSSLRARMQNIIDEIENGDTWHVSMECLFPAFDYAMIDSNGGTKIVKREEGSAFLTKHLRAYGGSGEYNGYRLGRLLRNFSFSGVGLVKKPANPRSVILNKTKSEEINMQEDLEVLKAELAEAKAATEKMKEEMKKKMEDTKAETEVTVADLLSKLSDAQEALAAEKTEKEKMAEEMKKMKEKASMDEEELQKMKKEKMMMKRKAQLAEAGFAEAELDETLSKFESLADEMFETVVAALKAKQPPAEKKEDEKPTGPKGDQVKAEEEVDANEADAEVLDSAEASEDIPMVESAEEEEDLRSFASEWFSKNVLKTTASIK
jgi:hypothetical protein